MVKLTWLGHSAVKISGSKNILIDPFISGNPSSSCQPADLKNIDYVFVTHHHADHVGDAFAICKSNNATLVAIHEIAVEAQEQNIQAEGMNIGGSIKCDKVNFHMVPALHSALKGCAAGVVVEIDGKHIYHAGDTGLTNDMRLIGDFFAPDLSFLPIGDRYTMGVKSAAKAVEFVKTKKVVPIHYNTFSLVQADPQEFKKLVGEQAEVIILQPGNSCEL